ncbi:TonB-dependent receptor [Candidatus Dependentiae bacterium]|nr:TonB-dependent receptor [Candidatus Dependentiae bacterium]
MKKSLFLFFILFFILGHTQIFAESDISLKSLEELMDIQVITSSKVLQPLSKTPATVIVLTDEQIRQRGYQCLDDIINDLPGFDMVNVWGTWPLQWAQRGNYGDENKRTLFLVDGILENNLMEGSVLGGQQYSLHNIKQIEILYGPASALYGANAFGGVINLITKNGSDINGNKVEVGYGSWNTRYLKLLSGYEFNDFSYSLSFSIFSSEGPVFSERHPEYDNSYIDGAKSILGRVKFKHIKFGFNFFDRPMGEGTFGNAPTDAYGLQPYGYNNESAGGNMDGKMGQTGKVTKWEPKNTTIFLTADNKINENLDFKFTVSLRNTKLDGFEDQFYDTSWGLAGETSGFYKQYYSHNSLTAGAEFQLNYIINEYKNIIFGLQYDNSIISKNYIQGDVYASTLIGGIDSFFEDVSEIKSKIPYIGATNYACYLQYEHIPESYSNIKITSGLRYDYNSFYESVLTPRIGLVLAASKKINIKAFYGEAFRSPNNFEMYSTSNVRILNPDLKPEKEKSCEVVLAYTPLTNLTAECNIFYNKFEDLIISNVDIGGGKKQNKNAGEARVTGIELKSRYNTKYNIFEFNYTYQNPKNITEDIQIANTAKNKFNLIVTSTYIPYINSSITANYVGKRSVISTNPRNGVEGYINFDLTFTDKKRFFKDKLGFMLKINNLFDTDYDDPGMRSASGGYYSTTHPQPGRNFLASLNVQF